MKIAFVTAVVLVSGINVFNVQKSEPLSEIALANVEALAYYVESGESGYECEAPFNNICSVELGVEFLGYRLDL